MTKALLINNDSDTWQELVNTSVAAGFDITVVSCHELSTINPNDYDVIILSGGWWYDDEIQHLEVYKDELQLIRESSVPVLGICIGMQLMQIAYSGQVQLLDSPQRDLHRIEINPAGQMLLGWPQTVQVHKNHTMGAITTTPEFEVLASSPGHVEIIKHKTRPVLGVQFHPEVGEEASCLTMLRQLVNAVMSLSSDRFVSGSRSQYLEQSLLIKPRQALDESWAARLFDAGKHAAEVWAFLASDPSRLNRAYERFNPDDPETYPSLLADVKHRRIMLQGRQRLETLREDISSQENDPRIRSAYHARIEELLANLQLYEASIQGDMDEYRRINMHLYGAPNPEVFAATCDYLRGLAAEWTALKPDLAELASGLDSWMLDGGNARVLHPDDTVFYQQHKLHMDNDGFYAQLFHGLPLPTGTVTVSIGDALVKQLLVNLGAEDYVIADSSDGYWGVRAGIRTIMRPGNYALSVEQFLGVVGHEIGSHLLERLNGDRQSIRLLSLGLAGYEQGNEGRAFIREQVTYGSWQEFAKQWRWYEILRRHVAVSLGEGLGRGGNTFGDVFRALYGMDLLRAHALTAPNQEVDKEAVKRITWELATRVLKGTNGQGGAYFKDIVYLQGNIACWRVAGESPDVIRIGDLGKVDITNASHLAFVASLH